MRGHVWVVDNYDSFTYNLVHLIEKQGFKTTVVLNDEVSISTIKEASPHAILLSPGPGHPSHAGLSNVVASEVFAGNIKCPVLGVCLGHQVLAMTTGALIKKADRIMHGQVVPILHQKKGLFQNIANPTEVTRYHSLIVEPKSLSADWVVDAWCDLEHRSSGREIMAIRHQTLPIYGMQFHPESIASKTGEQIMRNFLETVPHE